MNKIQYDSEGRRLGAEITTTYHAWCEGCGWFGSNRYLRADAVDDQAKHDAAVHAA